jgi:hypothetical protein
VTKANLKSWVHDRMIFMAVLIFSIGGACYIAAGKVFSHESIWLHPFKEFSLLISMIGVVSFGYEIFLRELNFNEYKRALEEIVNPDAVRLGVIRFFKNRSELGRAYSFEALFQDVKKEIFIGGSSLLSIATNSRDLLHDKVMSGITVKLLLMDPNSPVVDLITKQASGKATFKNEIKTSLLLLQKLQDEIEEIKNPKKGGFIVKTYDMIPSHSFIATDSESPNGLIVADIGPYLGRNQPRPSMAVVKKKNGMFDYWQEMNDLMWKEGKCIVCENNEEPTKIKTLLLVSGKETQYYNKDQDSWLPATICQMNPKWRSMKGSQWVWVDESVTLEEAKTGSRNKMRTQLEIPINGKGNIVRAELFLRSDDNCRISINGAEQTQSYGGSEYPDPFIVDIASMLKPGNNDITFEVNNFAKPMAQSSEDNPAGLIYRLHIEYQE